MKILVVDDEEMALRDSAYVIRSVLPDVEIRTANSYAEVKQAMEQPIDIAFLDIEMPEKNGLEVARELQRQNPKINIIFLTAYSRYSLEAFRVRASDYLLKPLRRTAVEESLQSLRFLPDETGATPKVRMVCLDNFTVFADEIPLSFSREKSKELLAYLVMRRGVSVGTAELCDALWIGGGENKEAYLRKVISDLRKDLRSRGIEDILCGNRGYYSVNMTKISCDYFDYLAKNTMGGGGRGRKGGMERKIYGAILRLAGRSSVKVVFG